MASLHFGPVSFDEEREHSFSLLTDKAMALIAVRMSCEGYRVFDRIEVTVMIGEEIVLATAPGDAVFPSGERTMGFMRFDSFMMVPTGTDLHVSLRLQSEPLPRVPWQWPLWAWRRLMARQADRLAPPSALVMVDGVVGTQEAAA